MKLIFTNPGEPKGKARPRSMARIYWKDGKPAAIVTVYSDPEMENLEREIGRLFRIAAQRARPITGPIRVNILAVFSIPESWPRALQNAAAEARVWHRGTPDLDNIEKLIADGLNKIAWVDDGQIAVVTKGKRYGAPPRTEITIEALAQQADEITPGQRRLEKRVEVEGWDKVLAKPDRKAKSSKTDLADRPARGPIVRRAVAP